MVQAGCVLDAITDAVAVAQCLLAFVVAEHEGVRVVVDHGVLVRQ
jgi:phosphatidylglycerophosphate synthase